MPLKNLQVYIRTTIFNDRMAYIKPKKSLGQHFLKDQGLAKQITELLIPVQETNNLLEIGPGTGVLTQYLVINPDWNLKVIEIDREAINHLKANLPLVKERIIEGDFLQWKMDEFFTGKGFSIIGNFPYNISSQILFKILENRSLIPQMVGMFQKEVARRVCSPPKKKDYGILSVFIQAFYETEYLLTVDEHVFNPPPKVKSGVIRLKRKNDFVLGADEKQFFKVVKTAFNQRRKTLRNALKPLLVNIATENLPDLSRRAEELDFNEFIALTNLLFPAK